MTSSRSAPIEITYMEGHPELVSIKSQLKKDAPPLIISAAAIAGGFIGSYFATTPTEKTFAATLSQMGIVSATVILTSSLLERWQWFRTALTVGRAKIGMHVINNLFFLFVRPGPKSENFAFAPPLGLFMAIGFLMGERLPRHNNHMFKKQAEMIKELDRLFPDFSGKLDKSL